MGKSIKNINFLDVTTATEESLQDTTEIKNINILLYSKKSAPLLSKMSLKNINIFTEVPENYKLVNGVQQLEKSLTSNTEQPTFYFINGQLIVPPHISGEDIDKLISGVMLNGLIYCPEEVKGIIQQKIETQNGEVTGYLNQAHLITGDLHITNSFLTSLGAGTNLVVLGQVQLLEDLDHHLLEEKIGKLQLWDNILIREEYCQLLSKKLLIADASNLITLPQGAMYINNDLVLDATTIQTFQQATLYVTGTVRLEKDVTPAALNQSIRKIYNSTTIICPTELKKEIISKCHDPFTTVLDYSGKLVLVNGEHTLSQAELKFTKENLSFIVHGMLTIDDTIEAETLFEKISSVDNYGLITANTEQCGVIQSKLRTREGLVSDRSEPEDQDGGDDADTHQEAEKVRAKNMNFLKLN